MVLCFSAEGAVDNKCVFIIVKRGFLDNFFTTVHIDYICKIQYIAQIGNPFIHFIIQYILQLNYGQQFVIVPCQVLRWFLPGHLAI